MTSTALRRSLVHVRSSYFELCIRSTNVDDDDDDEADAARITSYARLLRLNGESLVSVRALSGMPFLRSLYVYLSLGAARFSYRKNNSEDKGKRF